MTRDVPRDIAAMQHMHDSNGGSTGCFGFGAQGLRGVPAQHLEQGQRVGCSGLEPSILEEIPFVKRNGPDTPPERGIMVTRAAKVLASLQYRKGTAMAHGFRDAATCRDRHAQGHARRWTQAGPVEWQ